MGLIALILSVVIDAVWPLRGRREQTRLDATARDAALDEAADPSGDVPYDPLVDPLPDPLSDPLAEALPEFPSGAPAGRRAASMDVPGTPVPHPLQRYALRLIEWVAPYVGSGNQAGVPLQLSMPGWLVVVGVPVLLVAAAQAILGAVTGFFVLLLHVAVLYLTVGLGAFHRQFSELRLLVGAGEETSARLVLARWIGAGALPAVARNDETAFDASARPLAGLATAHAILAAYRDVFAPLFWYAVLPGAIGPVLYLFARFAASLSFPFAQTAYYWLDWIPLRLATLGFALVGQFEDTMFCLKAVGAIQPAASAATEASRVPLDPYLHQRLLLLPAAGGALGLRLTDAGVDEVLRRQAPDLDLPGVDPEVSSLRPVAGLLMRSGVVWIGIYLLAKMLG